MHNYCIFLKINLLWYFYIFVSICLIVLERWSCIHIVCIQMLRLAANGETNLSRSEFRESLTIASLNYNHNTQHKCTTYILHLNIFFLLLLFFQHFWTFFFIIITTTFQKTNLFYLFPYIFQKVFIILSYS